MAWKCKMYGVIALSWHLKLKPEVEKPMAWGIQWWRMVDGRFWHGPRDSKVKRIVEISRKANKIPEKLLIRDKHCEQMNVCPKYARSLPGFYEYFRELDHIANDEWL
jgi:hypothetical protein